jgi:hypothetical protein
MPDTENILKRFIEKGKGEAAAASLRYGGTFGQLWGTFSVTLGNIQ